MTAHDYYTEVMAPDRVKLKQGERAWIANAGILVQTRRHEFFAEFAKKAGSNNRDGSASYIIPKGTEVECQAHIYEYCDGQYIMTPPMGSPLPEPAKPAAPRPSDEHALVETGHA